MDKNPRFFLYGHGGFNNKGCEAIVRATAAIIKQAFNNTHITLASYNSLQDIELNYDVVDEIIAHANKDRSFGRYMGSALRRIRAKDYANKWHAVWLKKALHKADVFLSIGGDNYCYGEPLIFYELDKIIRRAGKTNVFWGVSVEPKRINARMLQDLKGFDLITARESLTYEALSLKGLTNVKLYPDPAFSLPRENSPLPQGFVEGNTIGLNLSPLSLSYSTNTDIVQKNIMRFIQYLINNTSHNIALIPHVVDGRADSPQNDLLVLDKIYKAYRSSGRLTMIDYRYNASQLKDIIAKCRFFIGARTHATIAAYSTFVPTLAIGYSIKATGIARDVFGSEEGMVIPVQTLENENHLSRAFEKLREREAEIRKYLEAAMPGYIEQAVRAGAEIKQLVGRKN